MECIVLNNTEKQQIIEIAKQLPEYSQERVMNNAKMYISEYNKFPSKEELKSYIQTNINNNNIPSGWGILSPNGYEVSTKGDKRFSALNARFKEGTIIEGEDVGGKTIEYVYQNIIKKSGKGKAPSKDSRLFIPSREGYKGDIIPSEDTIFVFGSNPEGRHGAGAAKVAKDKFGAQYGVGEGLTGNAYALPTKDLRVKENKGLRSIPKESIIESIKTLYKVATENPGKQFKVAFRNKLDETTLNGYTGEEMIDMFLSARPIPSNIIFSEEWLNTGKFNLSKQEIEDFSYEKGYLPLWQEWAKQNPELIEELRQLSAGKILTDYFANTQVSQARALNEILRDSASTEPQKEEVKKQENIITTPLFNKNTTTDITERVDKLFTPQIRHNRVNLISRLFIQEAEEIRDEKLEELKNLLKVTTDANKQRGLSKTINNYNLDKAITEVTPKVIFDRIYNIFNEYYRDTEENQIQQELEIINENETQWLNDGVLDVPFSEEDKLKSATEKATYKRNEFGKLEDKEVFYALCEEACTKISENEGIFLTFEGINIDKQEELTLEGEEVTDFEDITSQEESIKDSYLVNFRRVNNFDRLSQKTRYIIHNIPKLDYQGYIEEDDLGNTKYLDANTVHSFLLDTLGNVMTSPEEMIPLLQKEVENNPWVQDIIDLLEEDEVLFSQFYVDFRKSYTNYWIQISKPNKDGTVNIQTRKVAEKAGINSLLTSWRNNYEGGIQLNKDSVYSKQSTIIPEKAQIALDIISNLQSELKQLSIEERINLLQQEDQQKDIMKVLNMLGINIPSDIVFASLNNEESDNRVSTIMNVLHPLKVIYEGIKKYNVEKDGDKDLINNYSKQYTTIAKLFPQLIAETIESNVRENGKNYYCYTNSNYISKLITKLSDEKQDEKKFEKFINDEFKQFDWFYNKEKDSWNNTWLKLITSKKTIREGVKHKVLLNHGKVDYSDMDPLTYMLSLYNEFNSEPDKDGINWAWYYVPILADAPSAEFIRFKKYTKELKDDGSTANYDELIIDEMVNLVLQEYNRIMLVRERDDLYYNKKSNTIQPIANFDITRKKGIITNLGGAEFKFLPQLNSYIVEDVTFLEGLSKLKSDKSTTGEDIKNYIKNAIYDIFENEFEKEYSRYSEIGLLDKVPVTEKTKDVKPKYIYFDTNNETEVKEKLRNYFYNSTFATSQIIQLLTTDLAFYKNLEDFQKRFKEVHAPSLKLNTQATYNGKRVGKEIERTIYIKDSIIKSAIVDDIKNIFTKQVAEGKMTESEMQSILEKYEEVNVADAQAFRSLPSYREIKCMLGEWNEEMEQTYNNIINNKPTAKDLNTIWQPFKPFVYTQVAKDNNIDGQKIKVPIQHKNSEFPLMALYNIASQTLGKSSKLKAINQFMIDTNIDVVQFESTTKVGKQGVIDLDGLEDYQEVYDKLKASITLNGVENPNVVHTIPYEDYGIQTATPEHFLDIEQLIGTQIRKLITADIPDNAVFKVGDNSYSKKELLSLYNQVLVENLIDSYDVKEEFKDPKKVEQILQEEIKSSSRYGRELAKACLLDENGKFYLPLYDPIQSQRIQTLLNSIIKSRITKQKIKGGALIQVSGYSTDLKVILQDKDGNALDLETYRKNHKDVSEEEFKEIVNQARKSGEISVKYLEVYMPAYSKEFFTPLIDKDGLLHIEILPEELRKIIGFRVPTEDKYSMAPLYIKEFLSQNNGSSVVLPAEITTISGSDFDVKFIDVIKWC